MRNSVPILLIGYNRPDLTRNLISSLRLVRPKRLYFAVDGPRVTTRTDSQLVSEVRQCVQHIDWPCEVFTKFSETNLGLRQSVVGALDWFFGQEEMGIILEDDCAPRSGFFDFIGAMLEKYRKEHRVWGVSGLNLVGDRYFGPGSWDFVGVPFVWGWGTWASRWAEYDRNLVSFTPATRKGPGAVWRDRHEFFAFDWHLRQIKKSANPSTWDYQLAWTVIRANGLWVVPRDNLVDNLGFRSDATHTRGRKFQIAAGGKPFLAKSISAIHVERNRELQQTMHRYQHGVWTPLWTNYIRNYLRVVRYEATRVLTQGG